MIETGHWVLPTLHGEPRLAKPPLVCMPAEVRSIRVNLNRDSPKNHVPQTPQRTGEEYIIVAYYK